jgi:nucleoside-diphosphate-sugar epimerase
MKVLVTGSAGFIGSTLCERLISEGFNVVGIDSLNNNYSKNIKIKNLETLLNLKNFKFMNENIINTDFKVLMKDIDVVFHQAATAGVRSSWGTNFREYVNNNIIATQYLLENVKNLKLKKFIFASSSSVYGDADEYPSKITTLTKPVSPYGVTKLSSENLVNTYSHNYEIPSIALRYFTVYGPRQRPDMGFHKFLISALNNKKIIVYGDGNQVRDFTYVDDIVEANIQALNSSHDGLIYNIGGGSIITINECLKHIENLTGKTLDKEYIVSQKGDVFKTQADITESSKDLHYNPRCDLKTGLENQYYSIKANIDIYS